MDYLERDSRSCGVTYGLFDRARLLKSMLCYQESGGAEKPPHLRLGIKISGVPAVENFVQARFELFVQVYYHKTNRAIQRMLERISELAPASEMVPIRSGSLDELAEDYQLLGDDQFVNLLCGRDPKVTAKNKELTEIARAVDERRFWRRVYDLRESRGRLVRRQW